jgi:hypothetical protein
MKNKLAVLAVFMLIFTRISFAADNYASNAVVDLEVPTASWPVGNTTEYTNPPTLSWYLSTYAPGLTFEIQCVAESAPWPDDATFATSSSTSFTMPYTLTGGVQYAWRVRSTDGVTKSSWSTAALFTMVANTSGGPVVPTASWPIGNTTEYTNPPTLSWYLSTYAPGLTFEIQCVEASAPWPDDATFASSSTTSFTIPYTLNSGVQYSWRVRSTDGVTKSSWSTAALFTMVANTSGGPVVPITSWPVGNPTEYTNPPTLNWYLGTYAPGLTFEIQCVAASAPWPDDATFATSSTMSFTMPYSLTGGVQYAWRVRSTDGITKSSWSTAALFTMVANTTGGPVVPTASWPIDNPTEYTNPPTLSWYLETYAPGLTFEIQCVAASAPWPDDATFATSSTMSFIMPYTLTSGVQYAWRVRSTDGITKSSWSTAALFTMVANTTGGPVVPIASWPIGNTTEYTNPPTLSWYLGANAPGLTFEIQCVAASAPWPDDASFATSSTMSFTIPYTLTSGVQYAWRVRSTDGVTNSLWSTYALFTMAANNALVQPIPGSPTNSVIINTVSPKLFWYLPTAPAANANYDVQIADNPNFANPIIAVSNKTSLQVAGLSESKSYYWRVRSNDGTGNTSYYSGTGQFKIISSTTAVEKKEEIPTQYALEQNYPNPFNPTTLINYSLPKNSFVVLKIYDMLGREIKTLVNNQMSAGKYSVDWKGEDNNGNKVTSGIYIYRISAGNFSAARKMVALK